MASPPKRSRSSISIASIISVTDPGPSDLYRRLIVVAIDNSENSVQALAWAAGNLYRPGDKFSLLHVIPEPDTLHPWPGVYIPPDDAMEREEFKEGINMVRAAFAPVVRAAGVPTDVHLIVAADNTDSIAAIIQDKAEELHANAVVVASSGKKALQEFWVGSVTNKLTHQGTVPIIVFK